MAQRKTRKTKGAKSTGAAKPARRRRKTRQAAPWLKFEIIGLICICFGVFSIISILGMDTGLIGHQVDTILSYAFGWGRIVFAFALILLGVRYIIVRKVCPVGRGWVLGAWLYALALALIHVVLVYPGYEFVPSSLHDGGGVIGAVVTSLLRQVVGQVGAILLLFVLAIVTILAWKQWSISKPVAIVSDKASEEVSKISDKAVTGIQEASQSIKEWHERRKIFDLQKEEEKERLRQEQAEKALPQTASDMPKPIVTKLADGVEEVRIPTYETTPTANSVIPPAQADEAAPDEATTYTADDDYAGDDDVPLPEENETQADKPSLAEVTDVLEEEMADLKPVEVEQTATAVDIGTKGTSAVPKAQGERTYRIPPLSMLHHGPQQTSGVSDEVRHNAKILQETLQSFNIDAKILNASQGPAVTRYELEPAAGVKVSKIVHLADDLALKLAATDIRIEAPIPGKAAVGIEVPNKKLTGVALRDVLDTDAFKLAAGGVPVSLGKDIAGNPVVADLTKMPHLLVAGSTGSGKSVCINTFIASILFKQRPEDVKLILVDPKVVELSNYNGIPHLLTPVVTDPKKAASVLRWAVREMDDRYKRFALTKTRDITRYNELHPDEAMPFVVIIIDELADLMMVASNDVEESICRLAQKARACGMHLVLATQRPSVDVLTGLIKANVPSRIAFAVSSQIDSRTILDMAGAEKLIGKGDMLFAPMGASKPIRVQGAFISDSEIDSMVEFIKAQGQPQYDEAVQKAQAESSEEGGDFFEDDLMPQAIDMVLETGQASASMLQRRFRVGYTRAARMVDMMEAMHIVGPNNGSKPREILMTAEEVQQKYLSHNG